MGIPARHRLRVESLSEERQRSGLGAGGDIVRAPGSPQGSKRASPPQKLARPDFSQPR
jgi:hypothetical protein